MFFLYPSFNAVGVPPPSDIPSDYCNYNLIVGLLYLCSCMVLHGDVV